MSGGANPTSVCLCVFSDVILCACVWQFLPVVRVYVSGAFLCAYFGSCCVGFVCAFSGAMFLLFVFGSF